MECTLAEIARTREYPGRFLIVGENQKNFFAVYGVTARSASSRAKRYVLSSDAKSILVEPTNKEIMEQGNMYLLDYTAVHFFENGLVVGNGRQTDVISKLDATEAAVQLARDLVNETFEPDLYKTPRITGCVMRQQDNWSEALHIIRADELGQSVREIFPLTIGVEQAQFIATYAGPNIRPAPSFVGAPIRTEVLQGNAEQMSLYVYGTFAPQQSKEDLRVSVVAVTLDKNSGEADSFVVNSAGNT